MLRYLDLAYSWFSSPWLDTEFLATLAVIAIARWWEKVPWSPRDLAPVAGRSFLGCGGFLVYVDYLYLGNPIVRVWIAKTSSSSSRLPFPRAALSLTSVAFEVLLEELETRAYVIERVIDFIGNRVLAGLASVLVSLAIHLPGRDLVTMLLVTPIILLMTVLYILAAKPGAGLHRAFCRERGLRSNTVSNETPRIVAGYSESKLDRRLACSRIVPIRRCVT